MQSSFAALSALLAAALVFFTYNPANAGMSGLYNAAAKSGAAIVHKTGSRRGTLSIGLDYGLAVARDITASKNFEEYKDRGRDYGNAKGCPTGTQTGNENLKCFWKTQNKRFKFKD